MSASQALLAGSCLWFAAQISCRDGGADRRVLEYWWALGVFLFGCIGTLTGLWFETLTDGQIAAVRLVPTVVLGLGLVARTLSGDRAVIPPAGFALLFYFGLLLCFASAGQGFLMPLSSLLLLLPALIVPQSGYCLRSLHAGAITGISLSLLAIVGFSILRPQRLIGTCRVDKCSVWGQVLGPETTGNAIGIYLAAASAITLFSATRWYTFVLSMLGSAILIELTGSRSALIALGLIVVLALTYRMAQERRSRMPIMLTSLALCLATIVTPFLNWSESALTFRPVIWQYAIALFEESPLIGYGATYWVRNAFGVGGSGKGFVLKANYSTHNIALEILVSAGVLGAIAFTIALFLAATGSRDLTTWIYTMALTGVLAAVSVAEVPSAPGRVYLFPGLVVYLFVAARAAGPCPHVVDTEFVVKRLRAA